MNISRIDSEEQYNAAMARLDELFELKRTKEEQLEFESLASLIEIYEEENWPFDE